MTAHTPLRTAYSAMVLDTTLSPNKIVLMDTGNYPSFSSFLNETWTFNGTGTPDWTNTSTTLVDANGPLPGRTDMVMSFDGGGVMLYGGRGASSTDGVFQDTWTYDGSSPTAWTKKNPATVPFGRFKAQACYLAGTGVVMFGGAIANGTLLSEVWVWDGTTWTQVTVANGTGPAARVGHVMAANTSLVLMFGGRGTNSQFNDTWKYTTAGGWVQLSPTGTPSIRSEACMAWDSVNSVFVMHGGQDEYGYKNETWTFNPSGSGTWTQASIANGAGPSGRVGAQMAFDTVSGKTILFGGISATTNYPSNETWSFDASTKLWTAL